MPAGKLVADLKWKLPIGLGKPQERSEDVGFHLNLHLHKPVIAVSEVKTENIGDMCLLFYNKAL